MLLGLRLKNIALIESLDLSFEKGFSVFTGETGAGKSLFLFAIDYLLGDRELIALRSREITSRPLIELEDSQKSNWKWVNILLPSILIIFFGFIRFRNEKNRGKVLKEIYD